MVTGREVLMDLPRSQRTLSQVFRAHSETVTKVYENTLQNPTTTEHTNIEKNSQT